MQRRIIAAAAAALTLTLALPALPAQAAKPTPPADNYVAVGDSVAAGFGAPKAYPELVDTKAKKLHLQGNHAVVGAKVADIATQLGNVPAASRDAVTRLTLTVGANDIGWAETLQFCLEPGAPVTCAPALAAAQAKLDLLPGQLAALLIDIKDDTSTTAPPFVDPLVFRNAKLYVSGYYELFGSKPRACTLSTTDNAVFSISKENKAAYNQLTRKLNTAIKDAVKLANAALPGTPVKYVNVASVMNGHGLCDSARRWVVGPQDVSSASLGYVSHPNAKGQAAIAQRYYANG
ncbi:MAG: SGNH/GDSL hydrolase family protein, partial [Propionicimonas sp.]